MTRSLVALFLALCVGGGCIGCGGADAERAVSPPDPLDSITAEELYARGAELARAGDYVRAEQYLAASIERGYPEERAIPALMHVCVQASRLVAALEYAEPYLARHPTDWTLRMLVASIHMGLEHHEQARDQLQRVIEDAPEEPPQAHYFLGVLFRDRLDDAEAAESHFRRYLALAPEGDHRDEARAALPASERGIPTPVGDEATEPAESGGPERVPMPTEDHEDDEDPENESSSGEQEGAGASEESEPSPSDSPSGEGAGSTPEQGAST